MSEYEVLELGWNGWEVIYSASNRREAILFLQEFQREIPLRIKKVTEVRVK